nr:phosphate transporter permease [Salmonella sp. NCTC 7297]
MAATKPAFNPPGKKGDMIFSALVKLAALIVLLMLGGIIVSLIISSWPSIQKFGFSFLWTKEWDAPNDIYGALVPIYGTLVTSFIALLIAVPVSFGIALFLTELAPGWLKRPLGIAIELLAAIPSIVYGMWGLFIFAPLFATYFQEPVGNILSNIPFVGALFSRSGVWYRHSGGGRHPRHHDHPLHCGGYARRLRANAGNDERVSLWYRLYYLGSHLAHRTAVHQKWRHWRHYAGTGTCSG